jgi:xanthine dehydrogenase large subunit
VPAVFNVHFLDNDLNRRNIRSSKAVGEPPFMLGLSVWAAVKHALSFVQAGRIPRLRLPATGEEILLALAELAPSDTDSVRDLPVASTSTSES